MCIPRAARLIRVVRHSHVIYALRRAALIAGNELYCENKPKARREATLRRVGSTYYMFSTSEWMERFAHDERS